MLVLAGSIVAPSMKIVARLMNALAIRCGADEQALSGQPMLAMTFMSASVVAFAGVALMRIYWPRSTRSLKS